MYRSSGERSECRRVCVHVQPSVSSSLSPASLTATPAAPLRRRNRVLLLFLLLLQPSSRNSLLKQAGRQAGRQRGKQAGKQPMSERERGRDGLGGWESLKERSDGPKWLNQNAEMKKKKTCSPLDAPRIELVLFVL